MNRSLTSPRAFLPKLYLLHRFVLRISQALFALPFFLAYAAGGHAQAAPAIADQFQQATEAMRGGNLDQAGNGFAEIVKLAPTFAEAYLNLGLVREEQGRHPEAIENFKKAIRLKPRLRGANLFLGIAEFRSNHLEPALDALRKETAANPKDANAWMWLGIVGMEKHDGDQAADALDKAAKLAPDNVDILYHRGQAHLMVSNQSYARMFKEDPKSWRVRQLLAQANAEAERHTDAIAEYQAAIQLAPNEPRLHEELGAEFRVAGKTAEAEEAFRRELEIDPDNAIARYKLGVIEIEKGNALAGKQLILEAMKARTDLLHVDYNLGRAEMQLGNDGAAMQDFQRVTLADSDAEILQLAWYQLAIVYRHLHRIDDAKQALANFQKLKEASSEPQHKLFEKQREAPTEESLPPEGANPPH